MRKTIGLIAGLAALAWAGATNVALADDTVTIAHSTWVGYGPLYQGRFKSFPVQRDEHLLTVCRYVERNPLAAGLTHYARRWRWGSLWSRDHGGEPPRVPGRPSRQNVTWCLTAWVCGFEASLSFSQRSLTRNLPSFALILIRPRAVSVALMPR